ncbi:Vacuolar-sorting protein BRO1 [Camellia lanceoleosa]|uniref:Vacuolar-sorting protein BRO1 n=1 Tax=Camellia lanceoleosa TaxID=1840588 RepID=A0ACC0F9B0_9ERIC|nr:Vacuolar-sorting protein BRO1 [Camellia lanceoleosa]
MSPPPIPLFRHDLLQNYFKALCAVESRFPISVDKDHVNAMNFTWYDAFKTKLKASQQNIHLEKAFVLFNLKAVQSQIGLTFNFLQGDFAGFWLEHYSCGS